MTASKKRIGIIGIYHESNTFIPEPTTIEHFERSVLLHGEDIRRLYRSAHHEIGGFFQVLEEAGFEAVPILFVHAAPWGKVKDETLAQIWRWVTDGLEQAGPLDGILAAPHGAAVSESHTDMDGWWLQELRKKVGASIPIVATMDPHVNLSPAMVSACDALVAYRENPHLDQRERGVEAATIMVRALRGEIRPVAAGAFPPVAINIERQLTSAEPMQGVQRLLDQVRQKPGVLSASITFGFPYADIPEMGSAFVVVTDHDAALAQNLADELAAWLVANRELFAGEMISPEEALALAETAPKPVGLLDMGDNMGGGSPGDSTVLAHLLLQKPHLRTLIYLPAPEIVQAAEAAGIGARLKLEVGGRLPMTPAGPIAIEATVVRICEGKFTETQPRHGGKIGGNMGTCAVLQTNQNLTVLAMGRRTGVNASAQPLIACGLQPKDFDVIVIRGVHAPVGGYRDHCPTLIRVNTPGVTCADMRALDFQHRRRPLYPFESLA